MPTSTIGVTSLFRTRFHRILGGKISKQQPPFRTTLPPSEVHRLPLWYCRIRIVLGLSLLIGVITATALWWPKDVRALLMLNRPQSSAPVPEHVGHRVPHLAVDPARTAINQPLPLGIVLSDATGEETLVLSDFAEGTSLSAGSALSPTRWSVPARDLEQTFISAPANFDGIMQVIVTLYSSRQDVLETKKVRFQWGGSSKGDKLSVPTSSPQGISP